MQLVSGIKCIICIIYVCTYLLQTSDELTVDEAMALLEEQENGSEDVGVSTFYKIFKVYSS